MPSKDNPRADITLMVAASPRYYPHVERHLKSLGKVFPKVGLLYWEKNENEPIYCSLPAKVERFVLTFGKGGIGFFLPLMVRFLLALFRLRPSSVEAIDPYALIPARIYSLFFRCRIVYFSMEYFAEMPSLRGKPFKRRVWRGLEKWGAAGAAATATVCNGIADSLRKDFRTETVITVRNVPESAVPGDPSLLRERCGVGPGIPILLYQGALQEGRGLEAAVEAMAALPDMHLAIIGAGPLLTPLGDSARKLGVSGRVHFLGEVDFRELTQLSPGAFAGLAPFQPLSQSYLYSLPGKLFEYIQAEIPVVTTDLPEIRKIVDGYRIGFCLSEYRPDTLAVCILRLAGDPELYRTCKENLRIAKQELCWEKEEEKYLSLYLP
jgi:glycosyltransferase involved in cell wall biosynthesis